jgi:hypothetical protein
LQRCIAALLPFWRHGEVPALAPAAARHSIDGSFKQRKGGLIMQTV